MNKLISFIVTFVIMFGGSILLQPEEVKPVEDESVRLLINNGKPVSEMYEELMNEESKAQYEKMQSQMDDYLRKKEEHHRNWMLMVIACAALAIMPTLNMFIQLLRGKLGLVSVRDVLYVFGICIGTGILLFVFNLGGVYLMFFAERSIQNLAVVILLFGGGSLLWYASFKTKKKNQDLIETK